MKKYINNYKELPVQVRASLWFLICTIVQRSISIITTPIFTRMLSTQEYGRYASFTSWMGIITCFVTMYIYSGVYPQAIVKFREERRSYSSAMQGLTVALVVAWLLFYLALYVFWNKLFSLNTSQMLAMFLVIWGHAIFGFWSAEQRVDYLYKRLVIITLAEAIMQPILCIILIKLATNKVTGVVWGIAIANFVCYIGLFFKQMFAGRIFFSHTIWKYTLKLAIPLIPHYISSVVLNSSDRIMIQKLVGDSEAGIYNLAYTISICGVLINQAILQTVDPWIYQKIKEGKTSDIKRLAYPALVGVAIINLGVILFAPEIIRIFGPTSYYDAIWVMPPISLSVYFMFMYNLFAAFEFYYEKTTYISIATVIAAGMNLILNFIFVKYFGYIAAGYTTLICYIMFAFMHYFFMRKIISGVSSNVRIYNPLVIFLISLLFVFCGVIAMWTYSYTLIRYGFITIGVIICVIGKKTIKRNVSALFSRKSNV